jgi:hypothetical protein
MNQGFFVGFQLKLPPSGCNDKAGWLGSCSSLLPAFAMAIWPSSRCWILELHQTLYTIGVQPPLASGQSASGQVSSVFHNRWGENYGYIKCSNLLHVQIPKRKKKYTTQIFIRPLALLQSTARCLLPAANWTSWQYFRPGPPYPLPKFYLRPTWKG